MKITNTNPVTMAEAKEIVVAREKDGEMGYEQKLAAEHLKKFTRLKPSEAKKFVKELSSILKMGPETLATIVNIMPKTPDEVRLIFAREKFSLKDEEMEKILDTVKKFS